MKIDGTLLVLDADEPVPFGFVAVAYNDGKIYIEAQNETMRQVSGDWGDTQSALCLYKK